MVKLTKQNREKQAAQEKFCDKKKYPHFYIMNICGNSMWDKVTLEEAKTNLITGCPHCHRSFCE